MKKTGQSVFVELIKGKKTLIQGMSTLKYYGNSYDNQLIIDKLSKSKTKNGEKLTKILFPESYENLSMSNLTYYRECDIEKELYWGQAIFCAFSEEINSFLLKLPTLKMGFVP